MGNLKDPINPITGSGLGQAQPQLIPPITNSSGDAKTPSISGQNNVAGGIAVSGTSQQGVGIYGKSDKLAGQFDGNLQVTGNATVTGTSTVNGNCTVTGTSTVNGDHYCLGTVHAKLDVVLGSDCAEDFDIATGAEIEPGTVMVLADHGALRASQGPYDRKVA